NARRSAASPPSTSAARRSTSAASSFSACCGAPTATPARTTETASARARWDANPNLRERAATLRTCRGLHQARRWIGHAIVLGGGPVITALASSPPWGVRTVSGEPAIREALATPGNLVWVDFADPTDDEVKLLKSLFGFHDLAIEDCVAESQ